MLNYSIGEMIDKLVVIHLKIWHLEEKINELKDNYEKENLEEVGKLGEQVVSLNKRRVEITKAIDEVFSL
jgi:hypothetical protein